MSELFLVRHEVKMRYAKQEMRAGLSKADIERALDGLYAHVRIDDSIYKEN